MRKCGEVLCGKRGQERRGYVLLLIYSSLSLSLRLPYILESHAFLISVSTSLHLPFGLLPLSYLPHPLHTCPFHLRELSLPKSSPNTSLLYTVAPRNRLPAPSLAPRYLSWTNCLRSSPPPDHCMRRSLPFRPRYPLLPLHPPLSPIVPVSDPSHLSCIPRIIPLRPTTFLSLSPTLAFIYFLPTCTSASSSSIPFSISPPRCPYI
jgi:hypothetical protein